MHFPSNLQREFVAIAGPEAFVVARALREIEGNLGETYLVSNAGTLALFSRRAGGPTVTRWFPLTDISAVKMKSDGTFVVVVLKPASGEAGIQLQFSSWDQPRLEQLGKLWTEATGREVTRAVPASQSTVEMPEPVLTPLVAFCASLHAMIQCDHNVAPPELAYVNGIIPSPEVVASGAHYLAVKGIEVLLGRLAELLGPEQKRCLMANLLGVAMADGLLRSREQALLEQFREAMQFSPEAYATIYDVLMTKNNLQVFA